MINFVGRSVGIADDMREWGQVFGEHDARRQARWQQDETRRRYDEQNRANLAEAYSSREFRKANQGVFDDMSGMLGGLRPQGAPVATANGAVTGVPGAAASAGGVATAAPVQSSGLQGSNTPAFDVRQITNTDLMNLNPAQRSAWVAYLRATRTDPYAPRWEGQLGQNNLRTDINPEEEAAARARMRAVGLDLRNGRLVLNSGNYSAASMQWDENAKTSGGMSKVPEARTADELAQAGIPAPAATGSPGAAPAAAPDAYAQGSPDTSRGLQPTREMRLVQTALDNALRRADVASAHGQNEVAEQAFAQALQLQAGLLQHSRTVMYRAASSGNLDAAATLMEEFNGLPPGSARVRRTDEATPRFLMEIQNDAGDWVAATDPLSRNEMLNGFLDLIDAEGVAARSEAANERYRTDVQAGTQIAVATIQQRTALANYLNQANISAADRAMEQQIANGEAQVRLNAETGEYFVTYQRDGTPLMAIVSMEDSPAASTNGNGGTVRVPRVSNVTGIQGVRAQ